MSRHMFQEHMFIIRDDENIFIGAWKINVFFNYRYETVLMNPDTPLASIVHKCVQFIESSLARKERCLIQGFSGVTRSAAIAAAYIISQTFSTVR